MLPRCCRLSLCQPKVLRLSAVIRPAAHQNLRRQMLHLLLRRLYKERNSHKSARIHIKHGRSSIGVHISGCYTHQTLQTASGPGTSCSTQGSQRDTQTASDPSPVEGDRSKHRDMEKRPYATRVMHFLHAAPQENHRTARKTDFSVGPVKNELDQSLWTIAIPTSQVAHVIQHAHRESPGQEHSIAHIYIYIYICICICIHTYIHTYTYSYSYTYTYTYTYTHTHTHTHT